MVAIVSARQGSLREASSMGRALEPRFMFDAAAPVALAEAVVSSDHADSGSGADAFADQQAQLAAAPVEAAAPPAAPSASTEILFVDETIAASGLPATRDGVEVVVLNSQTDGLSQISQALEGRSGVTAIHLLTHGDQGVVELGGTSLDLQVLQTRGDEVAAWAEHLAEGADILIYGCDVSGGNGAALVDALAAVTGADIAASDDTTGGELLGGNWMLERQTGTIEAAAFASPAALEGYNGVLDTISLTSVSSAWSAVLNGAQFDPGQDIQALSAVDLQGNAGNALLSMRYGTGADGVSGTADDEIGFRVRMDQALDNQGRYAGYTWLGLDIDQDGDLDAFMMAIGKNGVFSLNTYQSGTGANTSPSTTDLNSQAPTAVTTGLSYSLDTVLAIDGANGDVDSDSKPDHYLSFKVNADAFFASINGKVLSGQGTTISGFNKDSALRFVLATSQNENTLNGDIGGYNTTDDYSTTYAAHGAFVSLSFSDPGAATVGDTTAPTIISSVRSNPTAAVINADSVVFRVTFSEDVTGVDTTDFTLGGTGASSGTVSSVSQVSASVYDVSVSGITNANGTLNLDLASGQNIRDTVANALTNTTPTGADETYTLDNTAPSVTISSISTDTGNSSSDFVTSDQTLTYDGATEAGASVLVTLKDASDNTVFAQTVTADGSGSWTVDRTGTALVAGAYTLTAVATDTVGNSSGQASQTVVVDTTAPTAPTVASQTTADTTPTITGTASVGTGETLRITVNGVTYTAGDGNLALTGTSWSLTIPSANALTDGTYAVTAAVTDAAGNVATDTTANEVSIVAAEPPTPDPTPPPPTVVTTPTPAVTTVVTPAVVTPPPTTTTPTPVVSVAPTSPVVTPPDVVLTPDVTPSSVTVAGAPVQFSLFDSGTSRQVSGNLEVQVVNSATSSASTNNDTEVHTFTIAARELAGDGSGEVQITIQEGMPNWMKIETQKDGFLKVSGERPVDDGRTYQVMVKLQRPNGEVANVIISVAPTKGQGGSDAPETAKPATQPGNGDQRPSPPAGPAPAAGDSTGTPPATPAPQQQGMLHGAGGFVSLDDTWIADLVALISGEAEDTDTAPGIGAGHNGFIDQVAFAGMKRDDQLLGLAS